MKPWQQILLWLALCTVMLLATSDGCLIVCN